MDFELKKKRYLACCGSLGFVNKDSLICDAWQLWLLLLDMVYDKRQFDSISPFFVYMPFLVFLVSNPFFFFFIVLTCSFFLWFIYIVGFLSKYKKLMTMEDFYIISFF
jgi:hypothetical protein